MSHDNALRRLEPSALLHYCSSQYRRVVHHRRGDEVQRPGTLTVLMEPLFERGLEGIQQGSSCIANAYSSNHDRLEAGKDGLVTALCFHVVDAVALVHALLLRLQALILPIQTLVFAGGH